MSPGPAYDVDAARAMILDRHVTSMITRMAVKPVEFAAENNRLQEIAASGRLGIPVMISTDPRSHFQVTAGASVTTTGFSQWPETLGLSAIDDPLLTRTFAAMVRDEYRAVGITMALSPQADLGSEPRWSRLNGTFGEDPARVSAQVKAYVQGMQGADAGLSTAGVATVVKHWVGYGAAIDGYDGHNYYGRFTDFSKGGFDRHVAAFQGAFEAGATGIMPTYTIQKGLVLNGKAVEPVGGGYSRELLTDLLRGTHRFQGLVLSDWAITYDCNESCRTGNPPQGPKDIAMPWGVEDLTKPQRFAKGMLAGIDQFGGVDDLSALREAVEQKLSPEARLDEAVGRVLRTELIRDQVSEITIIGVIPDIRFRSLKYGIQPTIMFQDENQYRVLSIRFDGRDPAALLSQVQSLWRRMAGDRPFNAAFVEDMIAAQYNEERVQATVFATFSGLAILVACLGLYGLSGFAARRRTKEIGLRKVFGATVAQIVGLLVWQFSRPVMIANLIAWPVAWWLLRGWLDGFEQRVELSPAYFVAAGVTALIIAWVTVAGHAAATAMAPPIKALRHE